MKENPLNRSAHLRLTEDETKALDQLQNSFGSVNRSDMLRKMIREAIGQGPNLLKDDLAAFNEAVRQVGALGRNINQIAHAIHCGQRADLLLNNDLLDVVAKQIAALEKELIAVVMRTRKRWVRHD